MSLNNLIVSIGNKEHFQMINNIDYYNHYGSFIRIINSLRSNDNLQTRNVREIYLFRSRYERDFISQHSSKV